MKRITTIFTSFTLLIMLFACEVNNKQKVAMLIASDTFKPDYEYFSDFMKSKNIEVLVKNAQYDQRTQITQAKEVIKEGIDILVIVPINKNIAGEIVRLCHNEDIKVIAYERIISNCDLDYFISFDNVYVGELLARKAIKMQPTGNVFILNGDKTDRNALWVYEGFMKVLNPEIEAGNLKITYDTFIEGWSEANATFEFCNYIESSMPPPDIILSAYNGMNNGIIEKLYSAYPDAQTIVTGQDADLKHRRELWHTKQQITLLKSSDIESAAAAELTYKILTNAVIPIDKEIYNGQKLVPSIVVKNMSLEVH